MRAALLLLPLVCQPAFGQVAADVKDCQPCTFSPSPKFPAYHFWFQTNALGQGRVVESIRIVKEGETQPFQQLPVKAMVPVLEAQSFFFGGVDLRGDGVLDLMLMTSRGAANANADYWLLDRTSGKYAYLGNYPVLRLDTARHRLLTYERGGMGGMDYEAREYELRGDELVLMKSESQQATANPKRFRRVTRERIDGVMKTVKTETVKAP